MAGSCRRGNRPRGWLGARSLSAMVIRMADGEPHGGAGGTSSQLPTEQPIEIRRHLGALRRSWLAILFFVAVVTAFVVVLSLVLPDKYRSSATIVQSDTLTSFGSSDVETIKRRLQTIDSLLDTSVVLGKAASTLPDEYR